MKKSKLDEVVEQIAEQWKILAAAIVVVLVVVAGYGIANEMKQRRETAATNALYDAQMEARKAVSEKKPELAEQAYQKVIDQHKGTRAAFEADLQMGDIWMDQANYDKAITHYREASENAADSFSKLLSIYTIGIAQESAGKLDEAEKTYEQALAITGSDFLRPELLMAQARCLEALKQDKKAIEIYKIVEDKYASRSYYSGAASAFEKQLSAKQL